MARCLGPAVCLGYWRDPGTGREYDQGGGGRVWRVTVHDGACPLAESPVA